MFINPSDTSCEQNALRTVYCQVWVSQAVARVRLQIHKTCCLIHSEPLVSARPGTSGARPWDIFRVLGTRLEPKMLPTVGVEPTPSLGGGGHSAVYCTVGVPPPHRALATHTRVSQGMNPAWGGRRERTPLWSCCP